MVFDLLLDLVATEGATLLMATHDRGLAGRCDRLVEMHDGKIREYAHDEWDRITARRDSRAVASAAWHSLSGLWLRIL